MVHICQSKILLGSFFFGGGKEGEGRGGQKQMGLHQIFFSLGNKMSKSSNSRLNNAKYLYLSTTWEKTPLQEFKRLNSKCNRCACFPLYFHNVHALETITVHAIFSQTKLLLGDFLTSEPCSTCGKYGYNASCFYSFQKTPKNKPN